MRTLGGFCIALLVSGGLFAQVRGAYTNPRPITSPFGSVVFPGGTSAQPGVQRTFGSVVFPGSGTPQFRSFNVNPAVPILTGRPVITPGAPGLNRGFGHRGPINGGGRRHGVTSVYAYPVFVGGGGYYEPPMQPEAPPEAAQPNITIVMPPQAPPVVISPYGAGAQNEAREGTVPAYQPPLEEQPAEPAHYLIAFKDHTVYSAVAYWVDGDTLHYFTAGNTHNQVSLSLIDRDLTARLNRDAGVEVKLPAPKQ